MSDSCTSIPYSLSLRNVFFLQTAEKYLIYIITPFALFCALFNVIFYIKVPNARQPPADILFFVSILSATCVIIFFISDIYQSVYVPQIGSSVPSGFLQFCISTGLISLTAEIAQVIYNVFFCFYYIFKIKNPLKSWVNTTRQIHILCLVLIILIAGVLYLTDAIGVSISGICQIKVGKTAPYISLGLSFTYLITLIVSSIFFLKYILKISKTNKSTKLFFKYYFKYLIIISFNNLIQSISVLIIAIFCSQSSDNDGLKVVVLISNLTRWITPIIITLIVVSHPEFKLSLFKGILNTSKRNIPKNVRQSFYQDLNTTNRNSIMIELDFVQNDEGYLQRLKQQNRVSLLSTILGCICLFENNKIHEEQFPWNFYDEYQMLLTDEIVEENVDIFVKKIVPVAIKFKSYSPTIFNQLRKFDKKLNIGQELNPNKNLESIYKNAQTDGGASGMFFLMNYSEEFILKTITDKQLEVLRHRMKNYAEYLIKNPQSFIVKLYGVYTAVNPETGEQIHFIIMANLGYPIHKKYVLRTYDLKGSSHHRQVLKDGIEQDEHNYYKTMKDKDFEKLQSKIWISSQDSIAVQKILIDNSLFFYTEGLIDYSLIIIKVNYNAFLLDWDKSDPFNKYRMFKSVREPGVVYILGIIDYLQTWNAKKQGEQWYKRIWAESKQISSQNPQFYSQRFRENLVKVIFP